MKVQFKAKTSGRVLSKSNYLEVCKGLGLTFVSYRPLNWGCWYNLKLVIGFIIVVKAEGCLEIFNFTTDRQKNWESCKYWHNNCIVYHVFYSISIEVLEIVKFNQKYSVKQFFESFQMGALG